MPWMRPTLDEIENRVEGDLTSRLTGNSPLMRKAVLKILGKALSALAHLMHGFLAYLAENVLADQAEGAWLDRIARARGLSPIKIAATAATGNLTLTGTSGTVVPTGTVYVADTGLEYATTADRTLSGGTASAPVTCRTAGADGNLPMGAVLAISTPIDGLDDTATTAAAFDTGADEETDEARQERLLALLQQPPAGGAAADYVKWARSINGVRNAWCFPNHYGGGTVAVAIAAAGETLVPSGALVDAVQAYMDQEDVRPVTANVTVVPIAVATVEIDVSVRPHNSAIAAAIQANLAAMFEAEAQPGGTLYLAAIQNAITRAGVRQYLIDEIQVDDVTQSVADIPFTSFQYMVLGEVNVYEWT